MFAGQHVFKANASVIDVLTENNALLHHRALTAATHIAGVNKAIIFRATPQWFVGMDQTNLRQDSLNEIKKTGGYRIGASRIANMVEGVLIGVFHVNVHGVCHCTVR